MTNAEVEIRSIGCCCCFADTTKKKEIRCEVHGTAGYRTARGRRGDFMKSQKERKEVRFYYLTVPPA